MSEFSKIYQNLNPKQREAVETIEGPLLVVAGPGTGKTQLLSARVAYILENTDTLPQNILCLTFTENGATNMRERLSSFIGRSAYDVNIGTYHAFGGDILRSNGEYMTDQNLLEPVDELKKHQIVSTIVDKLSYASPLKFLRYNLRDLQETISEMKRGLLTADDMRAMATENDNFIAQFNPRLAKIFAGLSRMPGSYAKARPYYDQVLEAIVNLTPTKPVNQRYNSLARSAGLSLELALLEAETSQKSGPLTAWKNSWLKKDNADNFILGDGQANNRLKNLADVFEQYQEALAKDGLYDFDDMILKAIDAIKNHDELRFTLQERYQYILLDEYQDTNSAQAELVSLLTDNPVNEGRPNIMAVGDDDQAIYAFQGAEYSNMLDFFKCYHKTKLVGLTENYRSHGDIIETAKNIAGQIDDRLFDGLPGASKEIVASNTKLTESNIARRDFKSAVAENAWVAEEIERLTKSGTSPSEIAVLSPKHAPLEELVPFLQAKQIPIRYEKRENILESPTVQVVLSICRLVLAIGVNESLANSLWPQVLSAPCFQVPTSTIWELSWQANSTKSTANRTSWTQLLLDHSNAELRKLAQLMTAISQRVAVEPCERSLDYILGTTPVEIFETDVSELTSPLRQYYLERDPATMLNTIANLTVLRTKFRDYQKTTKTVLGLASLVELVDAYDSAEQTMLNTSPYVESRQAIQLMTVYKAKGLEFKHVFLLGLTDERWGSSTRSNSNKLTLPANLAPTRHSGTSQDEKLRLLFVAITRAKTNLYLTSHVSTFSGKNTTRLKYLDEREEVDGSFSAQVLPAEMRAIHDDDHDEPPLETYELSWLSPHIEAVASQQDLLAPRLESYQLSPTHLTNFCDLIYGGPQAFFVNTLLRFPSAPGIDGEFGNTVHETLEWLQYHLNRTGSLPKLSQTLSTFDSKLEARHLPEQEKLLLLDRGHTALTAYLAERGHIFTAEDRAETNFRNEGVFVGEAHMAGKIDRLEVDNKTRTITVVDYKTGKAYRRWESDAKLHKYQQQLYCYKMLVEKSHTFKGYNVTGARLEFIEPDETGQIHSLSLSFNQDVYLQTEKLVKSMWQHVQQLDFPDTSNYPKNLTGIRQFESDLTSS